MFWAGLPALAAFGLMFASRAQAFGPWRHHGHMAAHSPAQVREHLGKRVDWLLDEVDASDAQRDKVDAILDKAAPQFYALMTEGRTVRTSIKNALLADKLERAKVEQARADLDALANRATDLGIGTLTDVAEVLTPAQRKQVSGFLADMHP